jgi:hypothetical protein
LKIKKTYSACHCTQTAQFKFNHETVRTSSTQTCALYCTRLVFDVSSIWELLWHLQLLTVSVGKICKDLDMNIYVQEQTLIYSHKKLLHLPLPNYLCIFPKGRAHMRLWTILWLIQRICLWHSWTTCLRTESFLQPFDLQDLQIFLCPNFSLGSDEKLSVFDQSPQLMI